MRIRLPRVGDTPIPGWLIVQLLGTVVLLVNLALARETRALVWVAYGGGMALWVAFLATEPWFKRTATLALAAASVVSAAVIGVAADATALVMTAVILGRLAMLVTPRLLTIGAVIVVDAVLAAAGPALTGRSVGEVVGAPALLIMSALLGLHTRQYRVRAEQTRLLLEQTHRAQREQEKAAALDERARIARELHDVLAHSLGALGIQLELAEALLADRNDPDAALDRIRRSRRLAADGLREAREAVAALRADIPSLSTALDQLAAGYRRDRHVSVAYEIVGDARPVSTGAAVSLLRIATESLTNAAKHAAGEPVELTLTYGDGFVRLGVVNTLAEDAHVHSESPGFGLTGMAERIALVGGTLTAGPTDDGPSGWRVTAEVPE